jgi:putative ABC transport system substrate-binding protein
MRRREFITLLGGAAVSWPLGARAAGPRPRIAFLSIGSAQGVGKDVAAFVEGLRAVGYVEGQTVDIDYRFAEGDTTRLKALAQELIALKPDLALANAPSPTVAVNSVAPGLPIICPQIGDVLVPSLAASYARPGGSVTGIAAYVEGLASKLLELALDAVTGSVRIGFLANPAGASMALWAQQVEAAARTRGVAVLIQEARTPDDLAPAFDGFAKQQAQAVIVPTNGLFETETKRIVQLALAARLPAIMAYPESVEAGGLASYGIDVRENYRRAAAYVDKVLKGAKPGDLPIEFPTKLVLAINLKTAKALGLIIHLAELTTRYTIPAIGVRKEFTTAGGLMNYAAEEQEPFRLAGSYTGRILKGEKPADLPVQQATKVELVINLKAAKALGITVPITLLGRADEVIE